MSEREQLALADALSAKTQALCLHLEDGVADVFDLSRRPPPSC